jgi:UDP-glucose 4-epimerase
MKCLVTGGAGFIGSHLIDGLLRNRHNVICVDNYAAGKRENIAHHLCNPSFTEVEADVCDTDVMNEVMRGVDFVFHQAASKKNVCEASPKRDLEVNASGTLGLLELAVKNKVGKFIHASTGSVYGEAVDVQDEKHPLNPTSYYGVSKLAGEKYVALFNKKHKLDTTILRYFHVYGRRQDNSQYGGVVSIFARNLSEDSPLVIYGDGWQLRSFTHVDDIVWCNLLSMTNGDGQIYNCASGISVSINELAEKMKQLYDKPDHPVIYKDWLPGDIKYFDIDNRKVRQELGMEFETNLNNGLKRTI